jgi:hypothetical protein
LAEWQIGWTGGDWPDHCGKGLSSAVERPQAVSQLGDGTFTVALL